MADISRDKLNDFHRKLNSTNDPSKLREIVETKLGEMMELKCNLKNKILNLTKVKTAILDPDIESPGEYHNFCEVNLKKLFKYGNSQELAEGINDIMNYKIINSEIKSFRNTYNI